MSITAAIVLYAMIWFWVFLMVLPMRLTSQAEAGSVVPGTPESAPTDAGIRHKVRTATLIGTVIWAVVAGIILSGVITLDDIDIFNRMGPSALATGETDG